MCFMFQMTTEEYGKQGFPGAEDFATFFEIKKKGIMHIDNTDVKRLTSEIVTFDDYVSQNKAAFIAMFEELK